MRFKVMIASLQTLTTKFPKIGLDVWIISDKSNKVIVRIRKNGSDSESLLKAGEFIEKKVLSENLGVELKFEWM